MLNRETVYATLFARLQALTASGFTTVSRRLRHVNDTPPTDQPALFMAQGGQTASYAPGRTTIWLLRATLYVYARAPQDGSPGATMNPLLDAIEQVFKPDNLHVNACTFGGVVRFARIDGEIETDEGTLGDQAIAIIPVVMEIAA